METDYKKQVKDKAREKKREMLLKRQNRSNFQRRQNSTLSRQFTALAQNSIFNSFIALLIIISVALVFAEIFTKDPILKFYISSTSIIITWIFVIELLLRFIAAPNKNIFIYDYWLDIVAVAPGFVTGYRMLNLLRLLRVIRAFLIFARQSGWFANRFSRNFADFSLLVFSAVFLVLSGTLALIVTEKINEVELSDFLNALWSSTFLFASGELANGMPDGNIARLISVLITISGMVVFAVLVGTISASMAAFLKARTEVKDIEIDDLEDHILVCGWDRMGGLILSELEYVPELWQKGVVVISETVDDIFDKSPISNSRRLFHVKEDYTKIEVLESVGARRAAAAIVLADKGKNLGDQDRDARTVLAALTLEKINPKIFTCAEILDDTNRHHLRMAGVEEIISRTNITAGLFASTLINRGVSTVVSDILSHKEGTYLKKVPSPSEFTGKTFLEVFNHFKKVNDSIVLSIIAKDHKSQQINPPAELIMSEGDSLLIVTKAN